MKRKILIILLLIIMIIMTFSTVKASNNKTYEMRFKILNKKTSESCQLYILLPKQYIEFLISHNKLELEYDGVNTIKNNTIPGLNVKKENIQEDIYEENGIEYIQIKLKSNGENTYTFDIISAYAKKDMKFRIKSNTKDYIVHIDNFVNVDNICDIEYNYQKDIVKQPDRKVISLNRFLILLLITIIVVGIISYVKKRR